MEGEGGGGGGEGGGEGDPVLKWDYSQDFLHSFNTNVEFNYF